MSRGGGLGFGGELRWLEFGKPAGLRRLHGFFEREWNALREHYPEEGHMLALSQYHPVVKV